MSNILYRLLCVCVCVYSIPQIYRYHSIPTKNKIMIAISPDPPKGKPYNCNHPNQRKIIEISKSHSGYILSMK